MIDVFSGAANIFSHTRGVLSAAHFPYVETLEMLSDGFIDDIKHSHFVVHLPLFLECGLLRTGRCQSFCRAFGFIYRSRRSEQNQFWVSIS